MLLLSSLHSMVLVLLVLMMITWQGQGWRQRLHPDSRGLITSRSWSQSTITSSLHILQMSEGESIPESMPRPNVLVPSKGVAKDSVEKFLMMYTCKLCNGRNAQMISKVAYQQGMVVSTCRSCGKLHLIADNEGKLDMKEYGQKIEEYLQQKGERVVKMEITAKDLEENYLVDRDGVLTLVPKMAGQPPADSTIVEYP